MKTVILYASICIASGILLVNISTSIVDVKRWGLDIPNSILITREYYKATNPGNFFRIFSPINQVLGLLVLILFWNASPSIRWSLGAAFLLYIAADVFTFAYFYPRNDILFRTGAITDTALLKRTVMEWGTMNWLRSAIVLAGVVCSSVSLHKIYLLAQK